VSFGLKLSQSQAIFRAFKAIRSSQEWNTLSEAQQRIVEAEIRDAELSGVALTGSNKDRFNEIQQTLAQLSTNFSNNVLDATKAFSVRLTKPEEVDGLPESALGLAAQTARARGDADATAEKGPWVVTLDIPSYMPVMQYAKDRSLRERLYRAYQTRASDLGQSDGKPLDNTPIASQILALRKERAGLLGKKHHAVPMTRPRHPSESTLPGIWAGRVVLSVELVWCWSMCFWVGCGAGCSTKVWCCRVWCGLQHHCGLQVRAAAPLMALCAVGIVP
jgi:oligopeptidase A